MKSYVMQKVNALILEVSATASDEAFVNQVVSAVRDGRPFSDAEIERAEAEEFESLHITPCTWAP